MDFGMGWGTDEIVPVMHHDLYDMGMTHDKIQKQVKHPKHKFPEPNISPITESFTAHEKTTIPSINEKTLIIILLVVLVILCIVMHQSVRRTQEQLNLILAILVSQNSKNT